MHIQAWMQSSKEEYARKRIHTGCSLRTENSVTRDNCSTSFCKPRDAKQLPSWQNFQSAPHNHKSFLCSVLLDREQYRKTPEWIEWYSSICSMAPVEYFSMKSIDFDLYFDGINCLNYVLSSDIKFISTKSINRGIFYLNVVSEKLYLPSDILFFLPNSVCYVYFDWFDCTGRKTFQPMEYGFRIMRRTGIRIHSDEIQYRILDFRKLPRQPRDGLQWVSKRLLERPENT